MGGGGWWGEKYLTEGDACSAGCIGMNKPQEWYPLKYLTHGMHGSTSLAWARCCTLLVSWNKVLVLYEDLMLVYSDLKNSYSNSDGLVVIHAFQNELLNLWFLNQQLDIDVATQVFLQDDGPKRR